MLPAGFMPKRIKDRPEWLASDDVLTVLSVSSCVSVDAVDSLGAYDLNSFWMFKTATSATAAASEVEQPSAWRLFYYEVFEQEFDDDRWMPLPSEVGSTGAVEPPDHKALLGFDVVTVSSGGRPECSPLSCNAVAADIETNSHCLMPTLEQAIALAENPILDDAEEGALRIFAVYEVARP
jgi:hypothetical protein